MKWGVAELETDQIIGTVTLFNFNLDNKRAEIGYGLDYNYWRKGYVTEALDALLSYAFDVLQLHRLEADVDPRNVGSIRTLEKMGFQREGLMRERWQVNGHSRREPLGTDLSASSYFSHYQLRSGLNEFGIASPRRGGGCTLPYGLLDRTHCGILFLGS